MIHYTDIIEGSIPQEKYYSNILNRIAENFEMVYQHGIIPVNCKIQPGDILNTIGFVITLDSKLYPILKNSIDNSIKINVDAYGRNIKAWSYEMLSDKIAIHRNDELIKIIKQIIYEINSFIITRDIGYNDIVTAWWILDKYEPHVMVDEFFKEDY